MSEQRLRDLLEERVGDVTMPDRSAEAWAAAARVRRRRTTGAVAAAAAVVAAVGVTTAVVRDRGDDPARPAPAEQTTTPPAPQRHVLRGPTTAEGYPEARIWWAASYAEEARLPRLEGAPIPSRLDLAAPATTDSLDVAVAAFGIGTTIQDGAPGPTRRVLLLGPGGERAVVDAGHLQRVTDEEGNEYDPLGEVSPDGRRVFFRQRGSLEVYELATRRWTTIETPAWLAEGARWLSEREIFVPDALATPTARTGLVYSVDGGPGHRADVAWAGVGIDDRAQAYGPVAAGQIGVVQSHYLDLSVTTPAGTRTTTEAVALRMPHGVELLAVPFEDGRWKGCCPVVGWLDGHLLFWSRGGQYGGEYGRGHRILAWDPVRHEQLLVSEVTGYLEASANGAVAFAPFERP